MLTLKIAFGQKVKKTVTWYKRLEDFPKFFRYNGKRWEWFMYNSVSPTDCELTYTDLPTYDPNFHTEMLSFEEMFEYGNVCECGAAHAPSFGSFDHMKYCKMHRPW